MTLVINHWVCGHHSPPVILPSRAEADRGTSGGPRARLFLSYGRRDAKALADRLRADLEARGYEVWQDTRRIRSGQEWEQEIKDGLRSTQLVVALLSPHAVRVADDPRDPDQLDSVCLDEISFARFAQPPKPIVPVMAIPCEPPFCIFRLDYVDMKAWQESEDQYLAGLTRLLQGIAEAIQGRVRYRSWEGQLRPWDFAAFLDEKRRGFCGRQWLFDEIDAWRAASQERALLITGDPGIGKSAMVAELVHRNPGGQVLAYHCCRADTPATLSPGLFIRSVAAMIASKLEGYAAQLEDPVIAEALGEATCSRDPASSLEAGILTPLQKLPAPAAGARYLLIDALDEALLLRSTEARLTIVDVLASRLNLVPPWLRVVATTRKERDVLDRLRGLRAREIRAEEPRNLEDISRYLALRLQSPNLAERLATSGMPTERMVHLLREKSAGNFLYLQQALEGIERDQYQFSQLETLPPGLFGLYLSFFERHFPDDVSFERPCQLLQVVVAAREPLTKEQLAKATGLTEEDELPTLLRRLAIYLPQRQGPDGAPRYALYHKSLADWLTSAERAGDTHCVNARRGHERLAVLGLAEHRQRPRDMSRYALAHLPTHLLAASRWDDLVDLLCDLSFLEAKAEGSMVFELVADFATAMRHLPATHPRYRFVQLLEEALRNDIHFMARHPTTLFQCMWNRGWWFDCPEAADHYEAPEGGWPAEGAPWEWAGPRFSSLLEAWRRSKEKALPGFFWVRSLRPPLNHLGTALRMVLRGHEGHVLGVAISPDCMRVVSGSADKTVRVWDAESGVELRCLRGHQSSIESVAVSPDGHYIASGSNDRTLRVWDLEKGTEHLCLPHDEAVWGVAYSPDGKRLASAPEDNTVRIWDAATGKERLRLRGHLLRVHAVAFSPDGHWLATASLDKTVAIWDANSGREQCRLHGHDAWVTSVAFSPDSELLASSSWDATVRIWRCPSGQPIGCLRAHQGIVESVAFSPDGKQLVSGGCDRTIRIWDVQKQVEVRCLRGHETDVKSVVFSPDGKRLVSGSRDDTVHLWNSERGMSRARLRGHDDPVGSSAMGREFPLRTLTFSADGRLLVSEEYGPHLLAWNAERGTIFARLDGFQGSVREVALSEDQQRLAILCADGMVQVWSTENHLPLFRCGGPDAGIANIGFSSDSSQLLALSQSGIVRAWDATKGIRLFPVPSTSVWTTQTPGHRGGEWQLCTWGKQNSYFTRCFEILIQAANSNEQVAWFPAQMAQMDLAALHPNGRTWAISVRNHLYIFTLEGGG